VTDVFYHRSHSAVTLNKMFFLNDEVQLINKLPICGTSMLGAGIQENKRKTSQITYRCRKRTDGTHHPSTPLKQVETRNAPETANDEGRMQVFDL
jgi:hypothetical protein